MAELNKTAIEEHIRNILPVDSISKVLKQNNKGEIDQLLVEGIDATNDEGQTSLMIAAKLGDQNLVRSVIGKGANINMVDNEGKSTLMMAASYNHYDIVKILIDAESNVNAVDNNGRSALMNIVTRGSNRCSIENRILESNLIFDNAVRGLDKNSDIGEVLMNIITKSMNLVMTGDTNIEDDAEKTPEGVKISTNLNCPETMELLIENGADVNLADNDGRTALIMAVNESRLHMLCRLLEVGANPLIETNKGEDALMIAINKSNIEMIEILKKSEEEWLGRIRIKKSSD